MHRAWVIHRAMKYLKAEMPGIKRIEIDAEFVDGSRMKMETKA